LAIGTSSYDGRGPLVMTKRFRQMTLPALGWSVEVRGRGRSKATWFVRAEPLKGEFIGVMTAENLSTISIFLSQSFSMGSRGTLVSWRPRAAIGEQLGTIFGATSPAPGLRANGGGLVSLGDCIACLFQSGAVVLLLRLRVAGGTSPVRPIGLMGL
jgi:hypothetical protein